MKEKAKKNKIYNNNKIKAKSKKGLTNSNSTLQREKTTIHLYVRNIVNMISYRTVINREVKVKVRYGKIKIKINKK